MKEGERISQRTYIHDPWICGDKMEGVLDKEGAMGKNWDTCDSIHNKIFKKRDYISASGFCTY